MTLSLYTITIPVFQQYLQALSAILDKTEAHAAAKKIDAAVFCATRLYPDMFPLSRQVQTACDFAKNAGARLAGLEPPKFEDVEKTLPELKARVEKTLAYVATLDAKGIDAMSGREIVFPIGPTNKMKMVAEFYAMHFALPNFFFHLTAAYAILRHCGIDIGKRDFMGTVPGLVPA
jgi:uncharacterized protein